MLLERFDHVFGVLEVLGGGAKCSGRLEPTNSLAEKETELRHRAAERPPRTCTRSPSPRSAAPPAAPPAPRPGPAPRPCLRGVEWFAGAGAFRRNLSETVHYSHRQDCRRAHANTKSQHRGYAINDRKLSAIRTPARLWSRARHRQKPAPRLRDQRSKIVRYSQTSAAGGPT